MRVDESEEEEALTSICSGCQISRSIDLTLLMCVPMDLCIPEHRIQRYTPLWSIPINDESRVGLVRFDSRCKRDGREEARGSYSLQVPRCPSRI